MLWLGKQLCSNIHGKLHTCVWGVVCASANALHSHPSAYIIAQCHTVLYVLLRVYSLIGHKPIACLLSGEGDKVLRLYSQPDLYKLL